MSRDILLHAFDMNCVRHRSPGLWRHPRNGSWQCKVRTVGDLAERIGIGGPGPFLVGRPKTVANLLGKGVEDTGVDGFSLADAVTPESFGGVAAHPVPEPLRRGRFKRDPAPATTPCETLFGHAPRRPTANPRARCCDVASRSDTKHLSAAA